MTTRRLFPLLFAGVCAALLAACDFAGSTEGATGRWVGTAEFEIDTILADHNVRLVAAYETTFAFDLIDDEGLITGTIRAESAGSRTTTEAGYGPVTLTYDETSARVDTLFGTYVAPVLEVDVPEGPYEQDLWTFDVAGRSARLGRYVVHTHQIPLANGETFSITLQSTEQFDMNQVAEAASEE